MADKSMATKKKAAAPAGEEKAPAKKKAKPAGEKTARVKVAKTRDGETAEKEKKARKKPAKRSRKKEAVADRFKIYWGVFNHALKRVALYEFNQRKAAEKRAQELNEGGKPPHFVQKIKEIIDPSTIKASAESEDE